jgi:hypothetical protein
MNTKWKALVISIVIYQIVLTIVVLKLAHYSQWLYFSDSQAVSLSRNWYEGDVTLNMLEALIWLGGTLLILITANIYFYKKGK